MANRHAAFLGAAALALGLAACGDTPSEPVAARATPGTAGPSNAAFHFATQDDFSSNSLSSYTIYNTTGSWSISGGYLQANDAALQSVVIRNGQTMGDGWVETQSDHFADGGLVLRYQSNGTYYLLAIRDDSAPAAFPSLQIYRRNIDGTFTPVTNSLEMSLPRGVEHTIRFEAVGSQLRARVNGEVVLTGTDGILGAGGFGVRHDNSHGYTGHTSRFNVLRWSTAFTEDYFDGSSFSSYTIHNTSNAWMMGGGYVHAVDFAQQSVMVRNGSTFTNGWVETRLDHFSDAGLVLRFQSNGNYYLLAIRDDATFSWANLEMYRAQNGTFTRIAGPVDLNMPRDVEVDVTFQASGNVLTAYVNGVQALQATDATYSGAGGFGIRHDNTRGWPGITSRFTSLRWSGI